MRFHTLVLLAAPLACLAQVPGAGTAPPAAQTPAGPKAPPEVDQALRARVNDFLTFQSKGNYRKAYDLVAEESKDYYIDAPKEKEKSSSFTVDEIRYGADLSTAAVRSTIKRQMMLGGQAVDVPQLVVSQWKLEKGEWVWYHDPSKDATSTIIGEIPAAPAGAVAESPVPQDLSRKAALAAAAKIGSKAAIDKKFVRFALGNGTTEQVTFHNSNPGVIRVYAEVRGVADTITVEPNDIMVSPEADVPFKITYKPRPESSMQGEVRFTLEPFGSVYVLPVAIATKVPAPKPAVPAVP